MNKYPKVYNSYNEDCPVCNENSKILELPITILVSDGKHSRILCHVRYDHVYPYLEYQEANYGWRRVHGYRDRVFDEKNKIIFDIDPTYLSEYKTIFMVKALGLENLRKFNIAEILGGEE